MKEDVGMKFGKVLLVSMMLIGLAGCSSDNADELKNLVKENEDLKLKVEDLEESIKSYEKRGSFTFKDEVVSTFRIINKIEGMGDKNLIVVSDADTDHNSLMMIEITDNAIFESIEIDKDYDMKVYYIFVVEEENQHSRVEITFLEIVE